FPVAKGTVKRSGPRIECCGTHQWQAAQDEVKLSILKQKPLSERLDLIHQRADPLIITHCSSHEIRISCSTVSKAEVSTSSTCLPESVAEEKSLKTLNVNMALLQLFWEDSLRGFRSTFMGIFDHPSLRLVVRLDTNVG
ncbi:hypothetical protein ILYODFUR_016033, partial [Ilyodon furcidens]